MDRWIAFYGREHRDVICAASEAEALIKARAFAVADGMSTEEAADDDEVFVKPADFWNLRDYGLIWLDERELGYYEAEVRA